MPIQLSNLMNYTVNNIKQAYSAVRNFVSDYWDVGAMLAAGFAFNDYHNEVLGNFRVPVMLGGIAGMVRAGRSESRLTRNLFAGFASLSGFWTRGTDAPLSATIGNGASAALMGCISLYSEISRRKEAKSSQTQQQASTEPLEKMVD